MDSTQARASNPSRVEMSNSNSFSHKVSLLTQGRRWWLGVLLVHIVSRSLVASAFWAAWKWPRAPIDVHVWENPTWWKLITRGWDGSWYYSIANGGYPRQLPFFTDSAVIYRNEWAFFPAFPKSASFVQSTTGMPWDVVAPTLVFAAGFVALCLVYLLVREGAPALCAARPDMPFLVVMGVAAFPGAGVLSAAYPEAIALAAIAGFLLLLVRQQYWWALVPLVVGGFTRGITLPLVAVLIWHVAHRMLTRDVAGRRLTRLEIREWVAVVVLALSGFVMTFVWPWIAGNVTGVPDAYSQTQAAWRGTEMSLVPFAWWYEILDHHVGVTVFLVIVSVLVCWWVFSPRSRSFGPELQAWGGAYVAYILMLMGPSTSIPRYLMLSILLAATIVYNAKTTSSKVVLIAGLLSMQIGLVYLSWSGPGFTP